MTGERVLGGGDRTLAGSLGWIHALAHATGASSRGGRSAYSIFDRLRHRNDPP